MQSALLSVCWAFLALAAPGAHADRPPAAGMYGEAHALDVADREPGAEADKDADEPSDRRARRRQDEPPSEDDTVRPDDDDEPTPGCIFENRTLELLV